MKLAKTLHNEDCCSYLFISIFAYFHSKTLTKSLLLLFISKMVLSFSCIARTGQDLDFIKTEAKKSVLLPSCGWWLKKSWKDATRLCCFCCVILSVWQTNIATLKVYTYAYIFMGYLLYHSFLIWNKQELETFLMILDSKKKRKKIDLPGIFLQFFIFFRFFFCAFCSVSFFQRQMFTLCPLEGSKASAVVAWQTPSWEQRISCWSRSINGSSM